jgi:hypothetical protein
MSDLFLLSAEQMARISKHFPLPHGMPRVGDQRVVSGIVYVIRPPRSYAQTSADRRRMRRQQCRAKT